MYKRLRRTTLLFVQQSLKFSIIPLISLLRILVLMPSVKSHCQFKVNKRIQEIKFLFYYTIL